MEIWRNIFKLMYVPHTIIGVTSSKKCDGANETYFCCNETLQLESNTEKITKVGNLEELKLTFSFDPISLAYKNESWAMHVN